MVLKAQELYKDHSDCDEILHLASVPLLAGQQGLGVYCTLAKGLAAALEEKCIFEKVLDIVGKAFNNIVKWFK